MRSDTAMIKCLRKMHFSETEGGWRGKLEGGGRWGRGGGEQGGRGGVREKQPNGQ